MTAGLALFDYDGDGDEDIYFLNGAPLRGSKVESAPSDALYRNDGGWRFTDVTKEAGLVDTGFGLGVAAADYDNDGDLDLYVNNYGPNVLYRNNGDGTFSNVTDTAGVARGDKVGAGACFLDIDKDGDLDLYVANYVQFTYENHQMIWEKGFPTYISPRAYQPEPDVLYRNNGDGTFADISQESGIGQLAGTGMGMVCGDFDNDGDTDIFVLNDVAANFLFDNDGTGKFEEAGLRTGHGVQRQRRRDRQHGRRLRRLRQRRLAGLDDDLLPERIAGAVPEPGQRHVRGRDGAGQCGRRGAFRT